MVAGLPVNIHVKFQFNTSTRYKDISLAVVARKTLTCNGDADVDADAQWTVIVLVCRIVELKTTPF